MISVDFDLKSITDSVYVLLTKDSDIELAGKKSVIIKVLRGNSVECKISVKIKYGVEPKKKFSEIGKKIEDYLYKFFGLEIKECKFDLKGVFDNE